MATSDEGEDIGVVVGALFGFFVLVFGVAMWKSTPPPVTPAAATTEAEIVAVGDALAKVYFEVGQSALSDADKEVVAKTMAALALKPDAIVLLSGFHDPSGDAATNATLAKARAGSVRDALVAGGVAGERIKFRKPESTVGSGSAQEGRRVEIRVQ
jgi:outer membrane protein OmpA-like peptidoglycan-associated protein